MTYTAWFDEIGKQDIALVGGKGANLGELSRAGLPVPPGYVVTTRAYDAFVESNDIGDLIVGRASPTRAEDPAGFEEVSERIRALFSGGRVPQEMADEIRAAYQELGEDPETAVAVRSSATAEDLAGASFAGQQDTYLNVRGAEALLEAVKNCWASLWTARAMAYRTRQGIDPATVSLAVVVQRMVESEAAGVMFTANPSNGRRDELTISAAWGLGESVVSGTVTPDSIVVEKGSGRVLSRETADKGVMTVYSESGSEERPVPEARRRQPVLDDGAAAELARYGKRIEDHYGTPQDIEWALAGGEYFVVQARSITALPEPMTDPPTNWSVPDPKGFYVRASIVEQMPDPLSPLFADLAYGSVPRSLDKLMNELLGSDTLRQGELAFPTVNGYAYYYYSLGAFWRLLVKTPGAFRLLMGSGERSGQRRWREYARPRYVRIVEGWEAKPPENLSAKELLAGARELLDAGTEYYTSCRPSSRLPTSARRCSPCSTTGSSGVKEILRHRPSCLASTACPSGPRSRSTTLPHGPASTPASPGRWPARRRNRSSICSVLKDHPPAWTEKCGASGAPASGLTSTATGTLSTTWTSSTQYRPTTPRRSSARSRSTSGVKDRTPTSARGGQPRGARRRRKQCWRGWTPRGETSLAACSNGRKT